MAWCRGRYGSPQSLVTHAWLVVYANCCTRRCRYDSVSDLGTPEEAAERLKQQVRPGAPSVCFN